MRPILIVLICALAAGAAAAASVHSGSPAPAERVSDPNALKVVRMAADSLVARHREMPKGGWAWRSAIQAPHFQTDRDVGAASVGEGLLAAYAVTRNPRYKRAAIAAGDFLLGVAEPAAGGLRWPDWADPDGSRSRTHFTSFDDGAAGISDYLWRLSRVTHLWRFRKASLAGMRWLTAQARGSSCPETSCSWRWTDDPSWPVSYYGVGMGEAGIVATLDAFADRTGNPTFRAYARAGAAHLRELTANGTQPLPRGSESDSHETGFLSGSAGAAYVFLGRYARDHDPADLATARGLLDWVDAQAVADPSGGLRWPVADDDATSAPGFELGAAGIAWVNLQAARATGDSDYREVARRAGVWLRAVRLKGGVWRELGDHTFPGARRARQRRRRDRLGARGPCPRRPRHSSESKRRELGARRSARRSGATTATAPSGTSIARTAAGTSAPSHRGTGARRESPPSPPVSPDGPAEAPAASSRTRA